MFKKISKITDYGVFKNFNWPTASTLDEFEKRNLIYGWNYSGKTTLARIFREFELKKRHPDFVSSKFNITTKDNGDYTHEQLDRLPFSVRVFSSDFISDNLKWDEGIEPIFILGDESIELQDKLKELKAKVAEKEKNKISTMDTVNRLKTELEDSKTDKARQIKRDLNIAENYDKRYLQTEIDGLPDKSESLILANDEYQKTFTSYRSDEKLPVPPKVYLTSSIDPDDIIRKTKAFLYRSVKSAVIERLKDNKPLHDWVETGLERHKGKEICEFCGNPITENRIEELNNHYSKELQILNTDLDTFKNTVKAYKLNLPDLPAKRDFYSEFQEA